MKSFNYASIAAFLCSHFSYAMAQAATGSTQGVGFSEPLTIGWALGIAGGTLAVIGAGFAWLYAKLIEKPNKDLTKQLDHVKTKLEELSGSVTTMTANERYRRKRLVAALSTLKRVSSVLRRETKKGDLESRIGSSVALVGALEVATRVALLGTAEERARVASELANAKAVLTSLRAEWEQSTNKELPYDIDLDMIDIEIKEADDQH